MDDTPEVIRKQMETTRLELSDKLESLEHQVSETVQSTGTAVNATVTTVQETIATVTDAVHDAVHSISNAFDVRRQFEKHPILVLGGAVAVGYLAANLLSGPSTKTEQSGRRLPIPVPSQTKNGNATDFADAATRETAPEPSVGRASNGSSSSTSWQQLKIVAMGAVLGIVEGVVSRTIPQVLDYLVSNPPSFTTGKSDEAANKSPVLKVAEEFAPDPLLRRQAT